MTRELHVLLLRQDGHGWGPVTALAQMAARLADTRLRTAQVRPPAPKTVLMRRAAAAMAKAPFSGRNNADLLVIAPVPGALNDVLLDPALHLHHRNVMAWVIDSFWTDRIPATMKLPGLFSHIFITDPDDLAAWRRQVAAEVEVLPWGTDALGAHQRRRTKEVDVVRVGRQPPAWDDDGVLVSAATTAGLSFAGRPALGESEAEALAAVNDAYALSRVVLASGNGSSPASYTHPTKEYVTARWTDSFANGCMVAGTPPRCGAATTLLPEPGLIRTPHDDVEAGMHLIAAHLGKQSERDVELRQFALRRLDWRHRLARIFALAEVPSVHLDREIRGLELAAEELSEVQQ